MTDQQELLNNQQEEKEVQATEVAEQNEQTEDNLTTDTTETPESDAVENDSQTETESEESEESEVLTLDDVDETPSESTKPELPLTENGDVDFEDFIDSIPELKRGMTVTGTITDYDDEYVYVNVGVKSEGKVRIYEFKGDPDLDLEQAKAENRPIEVYVRKIHTTEAGTEIELSKSRVDFNKHKEVVEQAFKEKTPLQVKVTNVVRDGVIASFGSVDMYIHRTQLELQIVEDLNQYLHQELEVLVTQFDSSRRRLRVSASRRSLLQRERRDMAKELWETIEVGAEYEGVVRNLTNFGAFVDIGGVDGLVHISELSWERIDKPSDVVSVGDRIKVHVIDFDQERNRVSLGFKRPENDPYRDLENRFPVGSIVRGVVVRIFPFGAFIEIAPGVDALCHISQISDYRLNRPEDVLQEGMEVDARVLDVNQEEHKISISIREVEPINPENIEELQEQAPRRKRRPRREQPKKQETRSDDSSGDNIYVDSALSSSTLSSLADITHSEDLEDDSEE
ncbi:MAG: S1 RNA-binding domain-containing protein [Clostridiaceae bacterium]|nr:S1 RNA-binding domain-containing protein [Clostridiaceae bacterium]